MKYQNSLEYMEQAVNLMPGGVNSPVRSFRGMLKPPVFIKSGKGAYITDEDGNSYIDYVLSWGPLILGHCDTHVVDSIRDTACLGTSFGAPCRLELDLARLVQEFVPEMEQIRMVNSGTEATMSALRLARGVTGRDKIIKFNGCYHGHADTLLVQAGSGGLTFGEPNSPGVPSDVVKHTLVAEYNDLESVKRLFASNPGEIATVIVEPVPGNMGVILPQEGFLEGLRELCDQNGSLLIFDEVMSGFRVGPGGATKRFGIKPDLICLGKVIGGGLPVGAFGGSREYMQCLSPCGSVYQAGTLSGNPLAMSAGIATLTRLKELNPWEHFEKAGREFGDELKSVFKGFGKSFQYVTCGSMFCLFYSEKPVKNCSDVDDCDLELFREFHAGMMEQGIYLAPSQYEAGFLSVAHTQKEMEETLKAFYNVSATIWSR
jgi:glutamate-1-semialdehyde 2,1-aminomutase